MWVIFFVLRNRPLIILGWINIVKLHKAQVSCIYAREAGHKGAYMSVQGYQTTKHFRPAFPNIIVGCGCESSTRPHDQWPSTLKYFNWMFQKKFDAPLFFNIPYPLSRPSLMVNSLSIISFSEKVSIQAIVCLSWTKTLFISCYRF